MTALHSWLTSLLPIAWWALVVLALGGCPSTSESPRSGEHEPITLPPPLTGHYEPPTPPGPPVDAERFRLTSAEEQPAHAPWLRLVYGQDLRGEIEACGCPGAPTGGLGRRATAMQQLREALPDHLQLEGPNALGRALTGTEVIRPQERARARLVLELLAELGVQAFFPGQSDFALLTPREIAATAGAMPVVASNLAAPPPGVARSYLWEGEGRRVLFLGLLGAPRSVQEQERTPTVDPVAAAAALVAAEEERGGPLDAVVAFTSAEVRERRRWREAGLTLDLMLAPFEDERDAADRWLPEMYEVRADPLGRALRRVDLVFSGLAPGLARQPQAENAPRTLANQEETWLRLARERERLLARVAAGESPQVMRTGYDGVSRVDPETDPEQVQASLAALVVERDRSLARAAAGSTAQHVAVAGVLGLPPAMAEDAEVAARIDAYQELWLGQLVEAVQAGAATVQPEGQLLGLDACVSCHQEITGQWSRTAHAQAHRTLLERGEHRNPDCLQCHSTGFGQPGGFADPEQGSRLLNVQCEACHGPRRVHAGQAGRPGVKPSGGAPVGEGTCRGCHDPVNSPKFDYDAYRPKIVHGDRRNAAP